MTRHQIADLSYAGAAITAALLAIAALAALGRAAWRLLQPHAGARAAGHVTMPPDRSFYGSMDFDAERAHFAQYLPGEPTHVRARETAPLTSPSGYMPELAPDVLAEEELTRPGWTGEDGSLEADAGDAWADERGLADWEAPVLHFSPGAEALIDRILGDDAEDPADPVGPASGARPAADLLSQLSDDDFWMACRFELRRLAWMAWEPLALPAWTGRAAA